MPSVETSLMLHVPVEVAYRYLANPQNLVDYCPGVLDIRLKSDSHKFNWTYKMIGVRFEGDAELKLTYPNQQLKLQFWGGISGSATWHLHTINGGTKLTLILDYHVPLPLQRKHTLEAITQSNLHAVDCTLASLKTLLEAQFAVQSVP